MRLLCYDGASWVKVMLKGENHVSRSRWGWFGRLVIVGCGPGLGERRLGESVVAQRGSHLSSRARGWRVRPTERAFPNCCPGRGRDGNEAELSSTRTNLWGASRRPRRRLCSCEGLWTAGTERDPKTSFRRRQPLLSLLVKRSNFLFCFAF